MLSRCFKAVTKKIKGRYESERQLSNDGRWVAIQIVRRFLPSVSDIKQSATEFRVSSATGQLAQLHDLTPPPHRRRHFYFDGHEFFPLTVARHKLGEVGPNAIFVLQPNPIAHGRSANADVLDYAGDLDVDLSDLPIPDWLADCVKNRNH
jgi:hypothetical protein